MTSKKRFIFKLLFVTSKRFYKGLPAFVKPFWGTTKFENKSLCYFLFQLIFLGCLEQEGLIKFLLLGFSYLKNGNKHKTWFYKCVC